MIYLLQLAGLRKRKPPHSWPPPTNASGCSEGLTPGDHWQLLHLHHFPGGKSSWGYYDQKKTVYPKFLLWRWEGLEVPTIEDGKTIHVWTWLNAPGELKSYSNHGGDEDWVVLLPKEHEIPSWIYPGSPFGCCCVSEHQLLDGRTVCIGAHA